MLLGGARRDERTPETASGRCLHGRPAGRPHPDSGTEWQDGGGDDAGADGAVDADRDDGADHAAADSPRRFCTDQPSVQNLSVIVIGMQRA